MNREDNFKEKFKEALISTLKVISDDYKINENENKNLKSKNFNFLRPYYIIKNYKKRFFGIFLKQFFSTFLYLSTLLYLKF